MAEHMNMGEHMNADQGDQTGGVPPGGISSSITGNVTGQVATGVNITQTQSVGEPLNDGDRDAMRRLLDELREKLASEVPEEKRATAQLTVETLAQEVESHTPDPSAVGMALSWIKKSVPALGAWVASALVNPFVQKVIGAAGDAVSKGLFK